MPKDYYTILGVPHNATDKDVRTAYRRLARKYHPDVNPGQTEAESRFKEINEAHEILSDPDKRRLYDMYGHNWRHAQGHSSGGFPGGNPFQGRTRPESPGSSGGPYDSGGLEDLMSQFFGGGRRTNTRSRTRPTRIKQSIDIALEDAYQGVTRVIQVTGPTLPRSVRAEVTIPAGVTDGTQLRVKPSGQEIILVISVRPHVAFQVKQADLYAEVAVPVFDALLGCEVQVPTLMGRRLLLTMPLETQNGRVFRLSGQGMPRMEKPSTKGDLYVTVRVILPSNLSEREQELIRLLRDNRVPVEGDAMGGNPPDEHPNSAS
jgi:curved DNA-binding protein